MSDTRLIVSGRDTRREFNLSPAGTTVGRGAECDIVIDDPGVSRKHARFFQDPFGRWIVEDLGSRNGVLVEGSPVKARALMPGQRVQIAFYSMTIYEEISRMTMSDVSMVEGGPSDDIISYKQGKVPKLSPALVQDLNEFTDTMMGLSSPAELYSRACLHLADKLNTLVAIVRLPVGEEPMTGEPEVLACHFAGEEISGEEISAWNLSLSRKVLEAIRKDPAPVMAGGGPSGKGMDLTVIDTYRPHVVFAARVNDLGGSVDALYLDILESISPLQLFDFVEAAARQINFIQKNLLFQELEKSEKALREANSQLKEKDRIKDEYVSRVTHDIKGHLAAIQTCLYVAASDSTGPLNEKQADFLGRALSRNVQLTEFVRELLRLTRMRLSGQFEVEEFALAETITEALVTIAPRADEKRITVTSDVDPSVGNVSGDRFSINEMITNLLFNAVKYTPEGKSVHLGAKIEDGRIRMDIADTGIGIPAEELDNVFDEFFRATNAKKSGKEGTGLGLSLVRQIIERHGGSISVTSEEGEGSTFTVILPGTVTD